MNDMPISEVTEYWIRRWLR